MATTLDQARQLDVEDPLGAFGAEFEPIGDASVVAYLDGNSLGRPPKSAQLSLRELVTDTWANGLIREWNRGWLELPTRIGDRIAAATLGAKAGQTVVADSTTVLLYKAIRAAAALRPGRTEIVTDRHNFPTDRYVVEGIARELGMTVRWLEPDPAAGVTVEELAAVLGESTAVVTLSHVAYRSAYIADMAAVTGAVHDSGAVMVWDLCHSVGAVPVELDRLDVDFAVGCTYKFLNGGPGAPAFLYVNSAHHDEFAQPVQGWIGRADPFEMAQGYVGAQGILRALSGTPPITGLVGVQEGVAVVEKAGIERIRAKSVLLTQLAVDLVDEWLVPQGFSLASPREPGRRGGHVTVARDDARELSAKVIDAGVIIDFRAPDGIRLGLSPLTTTFSELYKAMRVIADLAAAK
jgi:kynureninase